MFGNLKNKLGEVADLKKYASPQVLSSLGNSRQRSGQQTPGTSTPSSSKLSRQPSITSPHTGSNSPPPLSQTIQEENLSEKHVTELEREIAKLKNALETQQDASVRKFEVWELEWKKKLQESLLKISTLEEQLMQAKEINSETKLQQELTDKRRMEATAEQLISQEKLKDVENRLYELQENYDQMEGLSTQEVAKIKHLLLNTSSEFEETKKDLDVKNNQIERLQNQLVTFSSLEERLSLFSEEKMELETQVAGLQQKLNASSQRVVAMEESQTEEVGYLKEKISTLESRSSNQSMEETEKVKTLINEREGLEHKLEETRQQLNNIKSSWSDKISSLESQIEHLNKKMSEDQIDLKNAEETIGKLNIQIIKQEADVASERENESQVIQSLQDQIKTLEEDLETQSWQSQNTNDQKDKDLKELRKKLHIEEEKNTQARETLQTKVQHLQHLTDQTSELEQELNSLRKNHGVLQEDFSTLICTNNSLQSSLNIERNKSSTQENEIETLLSKMLILTTEKDKLSSNLDVYFTKVEFSDNEISILKKDSELKESKINSLENDLANVKRIADEASFTLKVLEDDFDSKIEESELVQKLRLNLKTLEDEVSDKKQMLKVQGQRLADMKKTVQRELKMNPEVFEVDTKSKGLNAAIIEHMTANCHDTSIYNPSSPRSSQSNCNGDVEVDTINLKYLKHVVLKFITSREYEAVQLTKALATLLHMTRTEETLLRETLEWKMSWFGSRPNLGSGQEAKAIPPSQ